MTTDIMFDKRKTLFNGIEVWGVWREVHELYSSDKNQYEMTKNQKQHTFPHTSLQLRGHGEYGSYRGQEYSACLDMDSSPPEGLPAIEEIDLHYTLLP